MSKYCNWTIIYFNYFVSKYAFFISVRLIRQTKVTTIDSCVCRRVTKGSANPWGSQAGGVGRWEDRKNGPPGLGSRNPLTNPSRSRQS